MIRICPAELFSDMVLRIFGTGLAVSAVIAAAGAAYLIVSKKKRHNEVSSI